MTRSPARIGVYAFAVLVGLFLLLPTLIIVPMSFNKGSQLEFPPHGLTLHWYGQIFQTEQWTKAIWTSARVAFFTVIIATGLGTAAALGLARWRSRGKTVVAALLLSPMIVPVIVFAVGAYLTFSKWSLAGTMTGLVLAHTVLALPFVMIAVSVSASQLDPTFEEAAASLGANRLTTFRRVVLPLILPGVIAGALFAFITSWDEIVVAIFMTSPTFQTLPVVMWTQVRTVLDPSLAAMGTMLLAVSTLTLIGVQLLQSKRKA
jgi:putative spermidine/putrescine transport system permease protein